MNIYVYLDHNVIDDVSKGALSLKPSDKIIWVYSNENFAEIKRSGDTRFLDVLGNLKARKIELDLDSEFRMTGAARFSEGDSVYKEYRSYLEAISDCKINNETDLEISARLFGADNKNEILSHPDVFENNMRELLEPIGLYDEPMRNKVKQVRNMLDEFVKGPLQNIGKLEETRKGLGTNKGRVGNLADKENPINELWQLVSKGVPGLTADQYFGFDPIDKQGYDEWPMFLGIVGCHTMLNFLGFRPDAGLAKPEDLPGIMSDGSHIAYAAYCQGLLSRDRKLLAKAKAIYRYKNIATQVLSVEYKEN